MDIRKRNIIITHYRNRLADPDNLNAKYVIDAIRVIHPDILPEDNPTIVSEVVHRQEKVKKQDERTVVEIFEEEE